MLWRTPDGDVASIRDDAERTAQDQEKIVVRGILTDQDVPGGKFAQFGDGSEFSRDTAIPTRHNLRT